MDPESSGSLKRVYCNVSKHVLQPSIQSDQTQSDNNMHSKCRKTVPERSLSEKTISKQPGERCISFTDTSGFNLAQEQQELMSKEHRSDGVVIIKDEKVDLHTSVDSCHESDVYHFPSHVGQHQESFLPNPISTECDFTGGYNCDTVEGRSKTFNFPVDMRYLSGSYGASCSTDPLHCKVGGYSGMNVNNPGAFEACNNQHLPHRPYYQPVYTVNAELNSRLIPGFKTEPELDMKPLYQNDCQYQGLLASDVKQEVSSSGDIKGEQDSCSTISSTISSTIPQVLLNAPVKSLKEMCMKSQRGIFQFTPRSLPLSIADTHILIEKTQCEELGELVVPSKVAYVYNPLEYAFETHNDFVQKFCNTEKKVLFLGMNPGPWGMSQNGVPFGESRIVREWLKLSGNVLKPNPEHPQRPVTGLNCKRSEVSGSRFWGFFQSICGTPETFFTNCFVYNMCPLAFMSHTGKNITPPQIEIAIRQKMNSICDKALLKLLVIYNVSTIVGVGKFASNRARTLLSSAGIEGVCVENIMHPSPLNTAANKGWSGIVLEQLQSMQLLDIVTNSNK